MHLMSFLLLSKLLTSQFLNECIKTITNSYVSNQEAPTDVADLFGNVRSDVGDVPHGHERVEAGHLLGLLDVRLVREAEVMGDGCQEHLHADDKILRTTLEHRRFYTCKNVATRTKRKVLNGHSAG